MLNPATQQYQPTWVAGRGLNNVGLLVRVCGKVLSLDMNNHTLVIDDGAGSQLKCLFTDDVSISQNWTYATVTGVLSCESFSGQLGRVLLLTSAQGQ